MQKECKLLRIEVKEKVRVARTGPPKTVGPRTDDTTTASASNLGRIYAVGVVQIVEEEEEEEVFYPCRMITADIDFHEHNVVIIQDIRTRVTRSHVLTT